MAYVMYIHFVVLEDLVSRKVVESMVPPNDWDFPPNAMRVMQYSPFYLGVLDYVASIMSPPPRPLRSPGTSVCSSIGPRRRAPTPCTSPSLEWSSPVSRGQGRPKEQPGDVLQ